MKHCHECLDHGRPLHGCCGGSGLKNTKAWFPLIISSSVLGILALLAIAYSGVANTLVKLLSS
jgi:hypothetical protein